jgi:hypothetical protein
MLCDLGANQTVHCLQASRSALISCQHTAKIFPFMFITFFFLCVLLDMHIDDCDLTYE